MFDVFKVTLLIRYIWFKFWIKSISQENENGLKPNKNVWIPCFFFILENFNYLVGWT